MPKEVLFQDLPGGPVEIEFSDYIPYRNICSKCQMVSLSMYADEQNDIFCESCIDKHSPQQSIFCDKERRHVPFHEMHEAYTVITALKNMAVYCPNRKQGCTAISNLVSLQEHFMSCKDTRLTCGFCRKMCPGISYEDHTKTCPEKIVQCPYCHKSLRRGQLKEHKESCGVQLTACPKCGNDVQRMKFAGHEYACTGPPKDENQSNVGATGVMARPAIAGSHRDSTTVVPAQRKQPSSCNSPSKALNDVHRVRPAVAVSDYGLTATVTTQEKQQSSCNTFSKTVETGVQCEVFLARQMVDAVTQTDGTEMPEHDMPSAFEQKLLRDLRRLPEGTQRDISHLLEELIRFAAKTISQSTAGHSLGCSLELLMKQNERESGMQKYNQGAMSQEEYVEDTAVVGSTHRESGIEGINFSVPPNDALLLDLSDPTEGSTLLGYPHTVAGGRHDISNSSYSSSDQHCPSSPWEIVSDTSFTSSLTPCSSNASNAHTVTPQMAEPDNTSPEACDAITNITSPSGEHCGHNYREHIEDVERNNADFMVPQDTAVEDPSTSSIETIKSREPNADVLGTDVPGSLPGLLARSRALWLYDPYPHPKQRSPSEQSMGYADKPGDDGMQSTEVIRSQPTGDYGQSQDASSFTSDEAQGVLKDTHSDSDYKTKQTKLAHGIAFYRRTSGMPAEHICNIQCQQAHEEGSPNPESCCSKHDGSRVSVWRNEERETANKATLPSCHTYL